MKHVFSILSLLVIPASVALGQLSSTNITPIVRTLRSITYDTNTGIIYSPTNPLISTNRFWFTYDATGTTNTNEWTRYTARVLSYGQGTNARGLLISSPNDNTSTGLLLHAVSKDGQAGPQADVMVSRFMVRSDGNVGINVTYPQQKFHVAGESLFAGNILSEDDYAIKNKNLAVESSWGTWAPFTTHYWGPKAFLNHTRARSLDVAENVTINGRLSINDNQWDSSLFNSRVRSSGANANAQNFYAGRFVNDWTGGAARGVLVSTPNTTQNDSTLLHLLSGNAPFVEVDPDDEPDSGDEYVYNPNSRFIVTSAGNIGIGTESPTERVVIASGNLAVDQVTRYGRAVNLASGQIVNWTQISGWNRSVNFFDGSLTGFNRLTNVGRGINFTNGVISGFDSITNSGREINFTNGTITGFNIAGSGFGSSGEYTTVVTNIDLAQTFPYYTSAPGGFYLPQDATFGPWPFSTKITGSLAVDDDLWLQGQRASGDTNTNTAGMVIVDQILPANTVLSVNVWNSGGPFPAGIVSPSVLTVSRQAQAIDSLVISNSLVVGSNLTVSNNLTVSGGNLIITNQNSETTGLIFGYRTNNEPFLGLVNLLAPNNTTVNNETLFRVGTAEAVNRSAQFGFRSTNSTTGTGVAVFSLFGNNALMMIGANGTDTDIYSGSINNKIMTLLSSSNTTRFDHPISFTDAADASTTRSNLGLGSGLTTNISVLRPGNITNTLQFSNGILRGVTVP